MVEWCYLLDAVRNISGIFAHNHGLTLCFTAGMHAGCHTWINFLRSSNCAGPLTSTAWFTKRVTWNAKVCDKLSIFHLAKKWPLSLAESNVFWRVRRLASSQSSIILITFMLRCSCVTFRELRTLHYIWIQWRKH